MVSTIEKLANEVGHLLSKNGLTLTTAESCTGGGLSYWITAIPGSSTWFDRGFVTYSDQSKIEMLGVEPETIKTFGAVSEQTVKRMAEGALNHSSADISIAITGIAGPEGGSNQKPVGTVWIAFAKRGASTMTDKTIYPGDRQTIRSHVMEKALSTLLTLIKNNSCDNF